MSHTLKRGDLFSPENQQLIYNRPKTQSREFDLKMLQLIQEELKLIEDQNLQLLNLLHDLDWRIQNELNQQENMNKQFDAQIWKYEYKQLMDNLNNHIQRVFNLNMYP